MTKRKRDYDFSEEEYDSICRAVIESSVPAINRYKFLKQGLREKIMEEKLKQAANNNERALIGLSITKIRLSLFLRICKDAPTRLAVANRLVNKDPSDFCTILDVTPEIETFKFPKRFTASQNGYWALSMLHPKVKPTAQCWAELDKFLAQENLIYWARRNRDNLVSKLIDNLRYDFSEKWTDQTFRINLEHVGVDNRMILLIHRPFPEFLTPKLVSSVLANYKRLFYALPRSLKSQLRFALLLINRHRRYIAKGVDKIILDYVVIKHLYSLS